MIQQKVPAFSMTKDDSPTNSVETDDVQHDVDELLSDADRADRGIQSDESEDQNEAPANGATNGAANGHTRESDAETNSAEDDLAAPVDELIDDAVGAVEALNDSIDSDDEPTAEDEAAVATMADDVDELVEEAARAARPSDARETVAVVEFDDDDFDDDDSIEASASVESPAKSTPEVTYSAQATVEEAPQSIEALDARIEAEAAAFEEELDELEGDFHSADEIEALDDALPPSITETDEAPAIDMRDCVAEISLDDDDEDEVVAKTSANVKPAVVDSPFADDDAPPAPSRPPKPKPQPAKAATKTAPPKTKVKKSKTAALASVWPVTHRFILKPLARPLSKLDPVVRDSVGWVGLNTLFIAVCLWIFLMLR